MPVHVGQLSSEVTVDTGAEPPEMEFRPALDEEDRAVRAQDRRRKAQERVAAAGFDD